MAHWPLNEYDHLFKVKVIGDNGTGKSCILLRYCDDTYTESYISTKGIDFKLRILDINDKKIKLQMWDTESRERFRTIGGDSSSYRGTHAVIVVFDVTDQASFNNVKNWLLECDRYTPEKTLRYIVGNKCELVSKTVVDYSTANKFARQRGLKYFECSSKYSINTANIFSTIVLDLLEQLATPIVEKEKITVEVKPKKKGKESGCARKIQ